MGAAYQKLPEQSVASLGDAFLRIALARLVLARHETQISAHGATRPEPRRIFEGEHEGQGCERPYPVYLLQKLRLRVELARHALQLTVVLLDVSRHRGDSLEQGFEGRPQRLRHVRARLLVESGRRALGQTSPEGLGRPPKVVDELGSCLDERLARADDRQMSLGSLASVF